MGIHKHLVASAPPLLLPVSQSTPESGGIAPWLSLNFSDLPSASDAARANRKAFESVPQFPTNPRYDERHDMAPHLKAPLVGVLLDSALMPTGLVHLQGLLPELSPLVGALYGPLLLSLPQPLPPVFL